MDRDEQFPHGQGDFPAAGSGSGRWRRKRGNQNQPQDLNSNSNSNSAQGPTQATSSTTAPPANTSRQPHPQPPAPHTTGPAPVTAPAPPTGVWGRGPPNSFGAQSRRQPPSAMTGSERGHPPPTTASHLPDWSAPSTFPSQPTQRGAPQPYGSTLNPQVPTFDPSRPTHSYNRVHGNPTAGPSSSVGHKPNTGVPTGVPAAKPNDQRGKDERRAQQPHHGKQQSTKAQAGSSKPKGALKEVDTDQQNTLQAVDQHAISQASKDPKNQIDVSTEKALKQYKLSQGFRSGFADTSAGRRILTNYLQLEAAPENVFIYEIDMVRQVLGNSTFRVTKASDKQAVMNIITPQIPQLVHTNSWVTDNEYIWSTTDLFNNTRPGQLMRQFTQLQYINECGVQLNVAVVSISFRNIAARPADPSHYFSDPAALSSRRTNASILLRGFNAFLTKHGRTQTQSYKFISGNKGFALGPGSVLEPNSNDGLRALQGFFLSARPGIDDLLVNINTATSAFFGNGFTVDAFLRSGQFNHLTPGRKTALLRGVKVGFLFPDPQSPTGLWNPPESGHRFINAVGDLIGTEICHTWPAGTSPNGDVRVDDCFFNMHPNCGSRTFRPNRNQHPPVYPHTSHAIKVTPHAKKNSDDDYQWYPAEVLLILPDQLFHHPLTSQHTSGMISVAREDPAPSQARIMNAGFNMFGFNGNQQSGLVPNARMRVGQNMISIPGQWLPNPAVQYGNPFTAPNTSFYMQQRIVDAQWNLVDPNTAIGVHFAESMLKIHALPYINTTTLPAHQGSELQRRLGLLETALGAHNILGRNSSGQTPHFRQQWLLNHPSRHIHRPQVGQGYQQRVTQALQNNRAPGNTPILITISAKNYDLYAYIKRVAELQEGLNTIFVVVTGPPKKFLAQNASNIALKYNFKLAQNTHVLGSQDLAAIRTDSSTTDTIVIGADVTHPGKGSTDGCPSIAAVVGSVDAEFMKYPGSMRLQRSKKEYIIELGDILKERLIDWAEKNGDRLPQNMLFYRDGVSESQYAKLRSYEIPQIKQAYNWAREFLGHKRGGGTHHTALAAGDPNRTPWPQPSNRPQPGGRRDSKVDDLFRDLTTYDEEFKLTYVVVGKRHNTRFYPLTRNGTDNLRNGNVKPGLVVDQVITHPYSFDFYLQPHNAIIGTGRSAHYYVLQNNMDLRTHELQTVTHDLCYAYSRATKGVSYCAPAYYADRLCDRGRAYLRHWLIGEQHPAYQPHRPKAANELVPYYHDAVKDNLRDRAYWRPFVSNNTTQNQIQPVAFKYGFPRRNPWHSNMDNIMFYL